MLSLYEIIFWCILAFLNSNSFDLRLLVSPDTVARSSLILFLAGLVAGDR